MAHPTLYAAAVAVPQLKAAWYNDDNTSTIYLTDDSTHNKIALTLTNQLGKFLHLVPGQPVSYGAPAVDTTTLYLFFQGILQSSEVAAIDVVADGSLAWNKTTFVDESNGLTYLALSPRSALTLAENESVTLYLTQLRAAAPDAPGNVSIALVTGTEEENTQVYVNVQRRAVVDQPSPALLVGFVESDLVFTGDRHNALTLYITNPQSSPLVPGGVVTWGASDPVFRLSLVFGEGAGSLTSIKEAGRIAVNLGNTFGNDYDAVQKNTQSELPTWTIRPGRAGSGTVLGTGANATITLTISDIVTSLPPGLTFAYLSYANLPGYNDGFFALEIVKANPLTIQEFKATLSPYIFGATGPRQATLSFRVQNARHIAILNTNYELNVTTEDFSDTITIAASTSAVYTLLATDNITGQVVSHPLQLGFDKPDLLATSFVTDVAKVGHRLTVGDSIGIGTDYPTSRLSNTNNSKYQDIDYNHNPQTNLIYEKNSLVWEAEQKGYVGIFANADTNGGHGLAIRVGTYNDNCSALDISQAIPGFGLPNTKRSLLHVSGNGFVGIGTNQPKVPLDVASSTGAYELSGRVGYLDQEGGTGARTIEYSRTNDISIRAYGGVLAPGYFAQSDARLKTVLGVSDHASDLDLLARLRVTDYKMRDHLCFGSRPVKKIIAQDLEQVYPQAVSQHAGFVPDIYLEASDIRRHSNGLTLTLPTGLTQAVVAGQQIKLMGPAEEVVATLVESAAVGSCYLLVQGADTLADASSVFVFGLEHSDVRAVDYDALTALTISATQALVRQVNELREQNNALAQQMEEYRAALVQQQTALNTLQQQVASLLK